MTKFRLKETYRGANWLAATLRDSAVGDFYGEYDSPSGLVHTTIGGIPMAIPLFLLQMLPDPPSPPEPSVGSYRRVAGGRVFQRWDRAPLSGPGENRWWREVGTAAYYNWAYICGFGHVETMVALPPVTLPWTQTINGRLPDFTTRIEFTHGGCVDETWNGPGVSYSRTLTPAQAREKAAALWAAADLAEAAADA